MLAIAAGDAGEPDRQLREGGPGWGYTHTDPLMDTSAALHRLDEIKPVNGSIRDRISDSYTGLARDNEIS